MILEGLDAKVVDINNAFLNGDLDHKIFMKIPEGYKECIQDYDEDKALKLDKAIYGLVQAARQFWKKLTESTIDDLKQYFEIKKPTTLDDYLGVQFIIPP